MPCVRLPEGQAGLCRAGPTLRQRGLRMMTHNEQKMDDDLRQVLDICKGDYKAALRMVLVANQFYEEEIARLKAENSAGYSRGKVRNQRSV
jgi:hypothetical protein